MIAYAKASNKVVIGPATVGGIQAGAFRVGDAAGTIENLVACGLHRPRLRRLCVQERGHE